MAYSGLHVQGARLVHAGRVYLTGYLIAHAESGDQDRALL